MEPRLFYFLAVVFFFVVFLGFAFAAGLSFVLGLCGLRTPKVPLAIFPFLVFLSPFPIIILFGK